MIQVIPKSSRGRFNKFFKHSEFACNCKNSDCQRTLYNDTLIDVLFIIRNNCQFPLDISSGFRCQKHNSSVGGVDNSFHLIGLAADISTIGMDKEKIKRLKAIVSLFADYWYEGKGFIHIDKRGELND